MKRLRQLVCVRDSRRSVGIIILAAVLLAVILLTQYVYTRLLFGRELERQAESELTMKAILVKGLLNLVEEDLYSYKWNIEQSLATPDSLFVSVSRLVENNQHLVGAFVVFVPDYYPQKGRLFEPYAQKTDSGVVTRQVAGPNHDYTKKSFYRVPIDSCRSHWSTPYVDSAGTGGLVCTYSMPVRDEHGAMACVLGVDVSLDWLSDTINARTTHPSSFNILLTEDGKPIVLPTPRHVRWCDAQQVVDMVTDATPRDSSHSRRTVAFSFESNLDGDDGYVFYANMRGKPHWKIATVCYDKEVFSKLYWMSFNIFLLIVAALCVLAYIIRRALQVEQRLQHAQLERERIGSELRIASKIQLALLPQITQNADPALAGVDVASSLVPAREVGGDLYNFFVRNEKLYLCIGDVSGKGVPAALLMAVTQALFYAAAQHENRPEHIMNALNGAMCLNNDRNMFVTFFIGLLDLPTGRMRYCNAGHGAPVLLSSDTRMLNVKPNLPLGVMGGYKFEAQDCTLAAGDTLFLYTDGLTEAMDTQRRQFGAAAMLAVLEGCRRQGTTSGQMLEQVTAEMHRFVNGAEPSDDLTLLAVRYTPITENDVLNEAITLPNDVGNVKRLNTFVDGITAQLHLPAAMARQIKLAIEEAVVNVMEYAYPRGTNGTVDIQAKSNGRRLTFVITDNGAAFDPTATAPADITLAVDERPIGGLGIFLVRQLMDSINYERIDGKNVLTLRKEIPKELIVDNQQASE
ncbi:MAG: SpoIIE family protein phosphatase [Muribaculaceae bacterium]|nr:SpoIIE family protein phosphatase [Muribaculaceae bacterium]